MTRQSKNRKTWLDVTELVRWKGHFTGIQRVMYLLSDRYKGKENVHFIAFDMVRGVFKEVDFDEAMKERLKSEEHIEQPPELIPTFFDKVSARSKHVAKKVHHKAKKYLPSGYAVTVTWLKKVIKGPDLAQQLPQEIELQEVVMHKGDKLVILAGSWDNQAFIDHVIKLRKEKKLKLIQVVYDMIPIVTPGFSVKEIRAVFYNYMSTILRHVDGVVAISEATKRDVIKTQKDLNIKPVPISVMRLGDDFTEIKDATPPAEAAIPSEYILCVGTMEVRKNHMLLYYAVKAAAAEGKKLPKIVIAGRKGWLTDDVRYLMENDPDAKKVFILVHDVNDGELAWLYQNCLFTVYPAFYEGWGLPVAEALCYGKFCLPSNSASLPEIAGELLEYYTPYDAVACMNLMHKYANNKKALLKKESEIKKSYKISTWDETFKQFDDFLKTL